jgi:hypothetical protein
MGALLIWGTAAIIYGAFSLWYNSLRGPLTPAEIDGYMERLRAQSGATAERLAPVREFLAADDGREFFMVNLIRMHDGPVKEPGTGQEKSAREVLSGYSRYFLIALFRRAGHPIFGARGAGHYVENWGTEPDPGWTLALVVRYRSRRDMIELATDPRFAPAHAYKVAAMSNTLALPVSPGYVMFGARVGVALVVALIAALTHLAAHVLRAGG